MPTDDGDAGDADSRATRSVLVRGEYDKKGEKVTARVPALPAAAAARAHRPIASAWPSGWSIPEHPLTARVTVNRYWQMFFGTGPRQDGRGLRLAGRMCRAIPNCSTGWRSSSVDSRAGTSKQHAQRLIVTSATYRQSSAVTPELLAKDPENRLLARGPRFRLQAEFIRDQALAVSGLLNGEIGGASVVAVSAGGPVGRADVASRRRRTGRPSRTRRATARTCIAGRCTRSGSGPSPAADAGHLRRPRPRDLHRPPRRAPTRRCRPWS